MYKFIYNWLSISNYTTIIMKRYSTIIISVTLLLLFINIRIVNI